MVECNLARITGRPSGSAELEDLTRRAFESYARYWLETFRLVREDRSFFLDRFRCIGEEKIDEVVNRGKGAIVVVGHLGNWDAAGAWAGARGNTLVTVAEVLRPRRMFDFFVDHRASLGMVIHAAQSGVTTKLADAVDAGAVVAILGDRDLKGTGIEVKFFGEPATLPRGAATIALRTGVPVLIAGVYSAVHEGGKRGWTAHISDPLELPPGDSAEDVEELPRRIAEELETCIARHPEEWHVFQPFWTADRHAPADDR